MKDHLAVVADRPDLRDWRAHHPLSRKFCEEISVQFQLQSPLRESTLKHSYKTRRIARIQPIRRSRFCHNGACADNASTGNGNTGKNGRATANPAAILYFNWLADSLYDTSLFRRANLMSRRNGADKLANAYVIAYSQGFVAVIKKSDIDEYVCANRQPLGTETAPSPNAGAFLYFISNTAHDLHPECHRQ
jgi:hypothetical protein